LTNKAYNVRARGGNVMLLISDNESFMEDQNKDDQIGERVDIPTVIIKNSFGEKIKEYIKKSHHSKVIISIKFSGNKEKGAEMYLFMKSDDMKALHFFKEFENYYHKLSIRYYYKHI
jgi:hypothetical protein